MNPADFDSTRRYPVVMMQYSGPGSQQVLDAWSSADWQQVLVPQGFIVACVDGRGTGARGTAFRSCTYGRLGVLEAQDRCCSVYGIAILCRPGAYRYLGMEFRRVYDPYVDVDE